MRLAVGSGLVALGFALGGSWLGGCTAPSGERVGGQNAAVQGGRDDTTHTFAVGISIKGGEGLCSGVLVAPNVVLTARHCVSDSTGGERVDCKRSRFLRSVSPKEIRVTTDARMSTKGKYEVEEILVPSDDAFCGNDIAALLLSKSVPASEAEPATPLIRSPLTDAKKVGRTVAAIGYGDTGNKTGAGRRRIREDIPITCIPGDTRSACPSGVSPRELVTAGYVCEGDSGSGAFAQVSLDKAPIVIGVLSRGFVLGGKCTDAKYTRTDTSAKLILGAALEGSKRGGYELPAWASPSGGEWDAGSDRDDVDGGTGTGTGTGDAGDPYEPHDPDPYDPGGGERDDWLERLKELIDRLYGSLGIPNVPGADTRSPEDPTLPSPDAGAYDAGAIPSSDETTPAGGSRTGSSSEPGTSSSGSSSSSSGSSGSSSDDEDAGADEAAPEPTGGCATASRARGPLGGGGAGAAIALGLAGVALIRRRPREER